MVWVRKKSPSNIGVHSVGVGHSLWLDSEAIAAASSHVGNILFGSGVTQCLRGASTFSYVGNDDVASRLW